MPLYPTPTSQRVPYDRNGSGVFAIDHTGTVISLTLAQSQAVNDETITTSYILDCVQNVTSYIGVIFPTLRDLSEWYLALTSGAGPTETVQVSTNTITGADGTWTTIATSGFDWVNTGTPPSTNYRSSIQSVTSAGIKAIRFGIDQTGFLATNANIWSMHIYANPSTGANPDSLRAWQPVTNAELTTVEDYGDVSRGTIQTIQFRIHNQSSTKTGTSITVSAETLSDASPSLLGQFQFSTDNVTFSSSINIGNLGPGATSAILYCRNSVSSSAQLSVWALRAVAVPASFT